MWAILSMLSVKAGSILKTILHVIKIAPRKGETAGLPYNRSNLKRGNF